MGRKALSSSHGTSSSPISKRVPSRNRLGASAPSTRSSASTATAMRRCPMTGERGIKRAARYACTSASAGTAVTENGNIIALRRKDCPKGGAVSLEPGGQLELSGAPLENVHETYEELRQHLVEVGEVGGELGIGFLGLGFSPKWTLERDAGDAERALSHHAPLYADARAARPRHDVPHRDGTGEPGFRRRGRHGRQAARWPRAAAGRDRALRQLALHGRQAERLSVLPRRDVARHRPRPHRAVALRLR